MAHKTHLMERIPRRRVRQCWPVHYQRRGGDLQKHWAQALLTNDFCPEVYSQRNRIELFSARLKGNRRVATRYDRMAATYAAFIILAALKNWLKILC